MKIPSISRNYLQHMGQTANSLRVIFDIFENLYETEIETCSNSQQLILSFANECILPEVIKFSAKRWALSCNNINTWIVRNVKMKLKGTQAKKRQNHYCWRLLLGAAGCWVVGKLSGDQIALDCCPILQIQKQLQNKVFQLNCCQFTLKMNISLQWYINL